MAEKDRPNDAKPDYRTDGNGTAGDIGIAAFWLAQVATYIMSLVRWFATEHNSFWHGFKELVWALCPIVNFTYVWDWWAVFFLFIVRLASELVKLITSA